LQVATKGNYITIVEKLLEKSPNINTVDKDGMTALFLACKDGYQDIAFMLLNAGAYTNLQDRSGDTNLIHACKFHTIERKGGGVGKKERRKGR
jgi:ankyrin repeat-rich membrane spanning protein